MSEAGPLSEQERARLLAAARQAIRCAIENETFERHDSTAAMERRAGAFVTLRRRGELRGCIGMLDTSRPLLDSVTDAAVAAATRDHRFSRLSRMELDDCDLEISVLGDFVEVTDPQEVEVGRDGVLLRAGFQSGLFLPQVATEQGWDRETLLDHLCLKAGLPPGTWRRPDATLERFTAEVFGER
jgi:AmmeMemoRadiSam system protein A